jgi:hypothetical protein
MPAVHQFLSGTQHVPTVTVTHIPSLVSEESKQMDDTPPDMKLSDFLSQMTSPYSFVSSAEVDYE